MDDKHVDASTAMQQREGGYGGELHIKWSALEDEIRQSIMPMPDVASLRSTHQVRSDSTLTQEEMKQELVLSQQINYHFSSLKANYRGIQSCEWMRGVQLQGTWCRLGDPKTVTLSPDFLDAIHFDINVIESQLYPEGVAVVVATVPNDGTRKPIQRPRTVRRVKADVLLADILAMTSRTLRVNDMIVAGLVDPLKSGSTYDVRVLIQPEAVMYEGPPHYGFNVEDRDGRTLECVAATKEAKLVMDLLQIDYKRPDRPKHIPPYESTTVDVGYFALPARYSGWKRYIDELNACYRELVDMSDGHGTSPDSDLPDEVGEGGKPQPLITEDEIIANLRSGKKSMSRNDIIRRRMRREKEIAEAQGQTEDLVPPLDDDMDDVFGLTDSEDHHVNIDDLNI